jgi:N-acetylglucosamine-6-sulfatase
MGRTLHLSDVSRSLGASYRCPTEYDKVGYCDPPAADRPPHLEIPMRRSLFLVPLVALAVVTGIPNVSSVQADAVAQPNVLIIVTDDQHVGTLDAMPFTSTMGRRYENAFVPFSMCCPSRASILTGNNAHTHGVWGNQLPSGGAAMFDDSSTLATWLDHAGYDTGLFGKYLNKYGADVPGTYVPPGWDRWLATTDSDGSYFDWFLSDQGTVRSQSGYQTTYYAKQAAAFIEDASPSTPVFTYYAPLAPHVPHQPEEAYRGSFDDIAPWRPPSYNEADVSDKPLFLAKRAPLTAEQTTEIDTTYREHFETMQSVDDSVELLVDTLAETGRLDNTLIVYLSDNGYLFGEHRWVGKNTPYDGTTRVPFVMRYDAMGLSGVDDRIVLNIDIAPTIADITGVATPQMDGMSLVRTFIDTAAKTRARFLLEAGSNGTGTNRHPSYCGARSNKYLFVHYSGGFEEFYNYRRDPWELHNAAHKSPPALESLRRFTQRNCSPAPPGFTW